ncbi:MAG: hypothetical protein IJA15_08345 [Clostridia bacterium]|nr:hypothetical protein [Clostridia bacterium]
MRKSAEVLTREKVLSLALETKQALIAEWTKCGEKFTDKNYYTAEGLHPQAVGLASLLLMSIVFGEEKKVFPESEKAENNRRLCKMLTDMVDTVEREGYSISPYKSAEATKDLFGTFGYTDIATWVFSTGVLARYASRKGSLTLDKGLEERLLVTTAKSLKAIIEGQREDGSWGFRLDGESARSLFFTYGVSAAVNDFYNYVMGNIEQVEKENETELLGDAKDNKLIAYLNGEGGFEDVEKVMDEVKAKMQSYLIKECLPLLPKVASCAKLTEEENAILGVGKQSTAEFDLNYVNLYYAYYLIDMFIGTESDKRYKEIVSNPEEFEELKNYYGVNSAREEQRFSIEDNYYFFKENGGENAISLCEDYIEQAIHATRTNFLNATRTGFEFWDGTNSELDVEFIMPDDAKEAYTVRQLVKRANVSLKEPILVPMALRVNIQYCYYISKQMDKVVDDLFDTIANDRYMGESNGECIHGLWDNLSYNLLITERAIEAMIDAYDYVCMFEKEEGAKAEGQSVGVIDECVAKMIDARVEKAMKNCLSSEAVAKLVEKEVEKRLANVKVEAKSAKATASAPAEITDKQIIEKIQYITDALEYGVPRCEGEDVSEGEVLAHEMINLFNAMQKGAWRTAIAKQRFLAKTEGSDGDELFSIEERKFREYSENAVNMVKAFETRFPNLFGAIVNDVSRNDEKYLIDLYNALKSVNK